MSTGQDSDVTASELGFTESICLQLGDILLRLAGSEPGVAPSNELNQRFATLVASDSNFADWVQHTWSRSQSDKGSHSGAATASLPRQSRGAENFSKSAVLQTCCESDATCFHESGKRHDSQSCSTQSAEVLRNLPGLLLQDESWRIGVGLSTVERLLSLASLTLRLRLLEGRFTDCLETQKRQAIYNFAYGLSHELNNPLANIATRAGVLAQDEADLWRRDLLEAIVDSAMRGCEMLGDLMLVARPPSLQFSVIAVTDLLETLAAQARPWADRYSANLKTHFPRLADPLRISGDKNALTEALWSLLRNSLEAIDAQGEVVISCRIEEQEVCIEISDTGKGLSERELANCFDPYFSGREAGRGLGLGLSKAERIIRLHDGIIRISNRPNGGCSAIVSLKLLG